VLEMLPEEDLKEVDSFIVNIFRKYEAPDLGDIEPKKEEEIIEVSNLTKKKVTLLHIEIISEEDLDDIEITELISLNLKIKSLIVEEILDRKGTISRMSSRNIVAIFEEPVSAINTSLAINNNINTFTKSRSISKSIKTNIQIITSDVGMLNDEIYHLPSFSMDTSHSEVLNNRIIVDQDTYNIIGKNFAVNPVSELLYRGYSSGYEHFEVLNPINFHEIAHNQIEEKIKESEEKQEMDSQIEQELKKLRLKTTTTSSVSIAGDLEDIGLKLGKQLKEIEMYVQKRSTDRELIQNVKKMLNNTHNLYKVEISRLRIE
jgi:hypothetical protein